MHRKERKEGTARYHWRYATGGRPRLPGLRTPLPRYHSRRTRLRVQPGLLHTVALPSTGRAVRRLHPRILGLAVLGRPEGPSACQQTARRGVPAIAGRARSTYARTPRSAARRDAAAVAVTLCLTLGTATMPAAPAGATARHSAPVYHWFAYPGEPARHPHAYPQGFTGTKTLYRICLIHTPNECLGAHAVGQDIYIWITGAGSGATIFYVIWQLIINRQGRETPQDKGEEDVYHGKHEKGGEFNQCLDGRQSGSHRAVFTTNCFGNNNSSWIPKATNPSATQYNLWNYESALKAGHLSNLLATTRASTGADVYNAPNRSGLWATWGYYAAGTCSGC